MARVEVQWRRAAIVAAALLLLTSAVAAKGGTGASSVGSNLDFAISIPRAAQLRTTCSVSSVEVTSADIANGFVNVPLAWCIEIHANTAFEISFVAHDSWFESAWVRGLPASVAIRHGSGRYEEGRPNGSSLTARLGVTFYLAPATRPAIHAWPLSIVLVGE